MKLFYIFFIIIGVFGSVNNLAFAKKKLNKSDSKIEFTFSTKDLEKNYQSKELLNFINYSAKYYKTTSALFNSVALMNPNKRERKFLFQLKKLFKKESYLSEFKLVGANKAKLVSKKSKTVITVKDFKKGLYTYNGKLIKFDRTKSIEENLLVLANKIKPSKKAYLDSLASFFIELFIPPAYSFTALIRPALKAGPASVEFIKMAFSPSRLKDVALWMFAFQTMGACQKSLTDTKFESGSAITCIAGGLLWPAYWGFQLSSGVISEVTASEDLPRSDLEKMIQLKNISCPRDKDDKRQMTIEFYGEGLFLDIIVNYNKELEPVNLVVSENLEGEKKEDSIKIFTNKKWKKQGVRAFKEKSYFDIEEAVLLESAKTFSNYCKENPERAEERLKKMIQHTKPVSSPGHPGIGTPPTPAGNTEGQR